jgi:predicted naringenin-chalcone synthase
MSVHVSDLAVANPASSFSQDEMLDLLGLADDPFAQSTFARCGVRTRSLDLTPELLRSTLQQRTARTEEVLLELAIAAVDELAIDPAEIGTLITASYWSLGGPTLAATRRVALDDVAHWLAHPGGRGIVDGVQEALGLSDEDVAVSRDVLARHGNMGTPSALYVLRETIAQRRPRPGDLGLMTTIGPGVTVGLMLLEW